MITEHSRIHLSGKIISVIIDDQCELTFWGLRMGTQPEAVGAKEISKLLNEVATEASEIRDRIEAMARGGPVKQLVFEPADLVTIFKGIEAGSSNEARHIAYSQFYAIAGNEDLVLHIKSCPRIGDLPLEGKGEYDVLGFTRPRQKRLKRTLAPIAKEEDPDEEPPSEVGGAKR
jgi:hypothetical protein